MNLNRYADTNLAESYISHLVTLVTQLNWLQKQKQKQIKSNGRTLHANHMPKIGPGVHEVALICILNLLSSTL